nr:hypothetical transcript [Hymenolepis microstoma]
MSTLGYRSQGIYESPPTIGYVENLNQSQKKRLREIINAFQLKICHFSGIFEVVFPDFSASTTRVLPKIRRFLPLDRQWLVQLQNRIL